MTVITENLYETDNLKDFQILLIFNTYRKAISEQAKHRKYFAMYINRKNYIFKWNVKLLNKISLYDKTKKYELYNYLINYLLFRKKVLFLSPLQLTNKYY